MNMFISSSDTPVCKGVPGGVLKRPLGSMTPTLKHFEEFGSLNFLIGCIVLDAWVPRFVNLNLAGQCYSWQGQSHFPLDVITMVLSV